MDLPIKPFLTTQSLKPENQETPIKFLTTNIIPDKYFFLRNHFTYPTILAKNFMLPIYGEVIKPYAFDFDTIIKLNQVTINGLLECAGNHRAKFEPRVYGEQWEEGAISQGEWKGIPLRDLLAITGLKANALEVIFEAYDFGNREDMDHNVHYTRSLPLEKALHPDTILAFEYNGKPLSLKHGFPLRLIVPGWYGMASVKWLKKITVINGYYQGPFQMIDYVYYPKGNSHPYPVTTINVNSLIQKPLDYSILDQGLQQIEGIAWSGEGSITKVEVSVDGEKWIIAEISQQFQGSYTWTNWKFQWHAKQKGEYTIYCRAQDSKGRIQPQKPLWNKKGYGYNAIAKVRVKVE